MIHYNNSLYGSILQQLDIYMGILASFICIYTVLAHFCTGMIMVSNSRLSLALSLGHIFNEMCEVTEGAWPSDIAK